MTRNILFLSARRTMRSLTVLLLPATLICLLAGCSQADTDLLPDGNQPVTLSATVEGLTATQPATRATSGGSWAGVEEVAIQIDGEVKKYVVANAITGKLTAAAPFYWQTSDESKTASAWYSAIYSATQPTAFVVQADQRAAGYQQSDLIYAALQEVTFNNSSLVFKHLPAKVVVNLTKGEGVMADEVAAATVSIVSQYLTSGAITTADWSVAQQTALGSSTITTNVSSATVGYQQTVQALLVPQKSTAITQFIKVTIGELEFFYSTTLDLAAGTQYTYNITVQKKGLTVTASGAQAWTGSEEYVTSEEVVTTF